MNEQEIREGLQEYYRTAAVNNIHWIARELKSQLERNHRLDKQQQKMQALLERWAKELDGCLISANVKPIYDDTKQFLKEAKEVKHGRI